MTSSQNPQDLAPNFAASVFGFTNFFATSSGFISPLVVSYFTSEKVSSLPTIDSFVLIIRLQSTMSEWRNVFILDGSLYIASAIFFMFFGSGEVQRWNKVKSDDGLVVKRFSV